MKQAQFDIAIRGVPKHYAVFRVSNFPESKRSAVANGDLMYWNSNRNIMVKVDNSMGVMVSPDYLRFVSYMSAAEMHKENE